MRRYFWNVLIAVDQLANALLGGDPDETISSRIGKQERRGRCPVCLLLCRVLSLIDKRHCEKSIEPDEGRKI